MLTFLGFVGCLIGCGDMPPVRFQLGGLQGVENVEFTPPAPRPEMQIVTFDHEGGAVAKEVLFAKGTAADAAAALGFTLSVTSPASVGIGGGGVCITRDATGALEGLDFRAARLARGLLALQAKLGNRPWSSLVVSAETMARFGHKVSPALARDVEVYGGALVADNVALGAFMTPERRLIAAGDEWRQPRLADTLARLRKPGFFAGSAATWFVPQVISGDVALEPGTTGFAIADDAGGAVACALTMGRPFGIGSMTHDGGYLFPASGPQDKTLDQLALGFMACLKSNSLKPADPNAPRCPAPDATFSLMP